MKQLGWTLLRMSGGDIKLLLPLSDGRVCHIDIFVAFRVDETFYQLGNRSGALPESAILPVSTITLHGVDFPAPADPEAMLEFVYGPGWRVPDPSFKYADPVRGVRRLDGWLRGFRTDMGRWTEFHQTRRARPRAKSGGRASRSGSTDQLPRGAGGGRPRLRHRPRRAVVRRAGAARSSPSTSPAPRARPVIRSARRRRLHVEVRALILNELRTVLVSGAELARDPHHSDGPAPAGLPRRPRPRPAVAAVPDGAARRRQALPGVQRRRRRRRSRPRRRRAWCGGSTRPLVRREIEAAGGVVERERVRAGVDVLGNPDPTVCRMRVRWTRPADPTSDRES